MAANEVEKLEKKMESKIEEVRDMMLDRFCGVDHKLTAIEELLTKIMEAQNQVGNTTSKTQNKENKMLIGGDDGVPSLEYGASNPYGWVGLYTNPYSIDNLAGPDFGTGRNFCAPVWVGQQESSFPQKNRPYEGARTQNSRDSHGVDKESRWSRKKSENNGEDIVKTGQDEVFKDFSKVAKKSCVTSSGSWDKLADKTNVSLQDSAKPDPWGKKDSDTHSRAKEVDSERNGNCGSAEFVKSREKVEGSNSDEKVNGKTNVSLQDTLKPDPWGKKDSRSWAKEVDSERNGNCGSAEFVKSREKVEGSNWDEKVNGKTNSNDGWGKKADHQSQAQGSGGWKKNDDWGPKRKRPSSPTEGPNDGPRYSGPYTATKQRLDIFTSDEQEILTEIEPIMISIKRILNQEGYNDGDPLSADDQTCIIDHVFNHHPDKDQKMGAGIDYVMVAKHKNFPDSRCLYVVSTDGRKEDFSYIKCLQNFVTRKYPDKGEEFISKYLKKPRPRHRHPRDMDDGSVVGEAGRPSFQPGWNREPIVATYGAGTRNQSWHRTRVSQGGQVETKQDLDWRQMATPRWGS